MTTKELEEHFGFRLSELRPRFRNMTELAWKVMQNEQQRACERERLRRVGKSRKAPQGAPESSERASR